jgi:hypothetical protein
MPTVDPDRAPIDERRDEDLHSVGHSKWSNTSRADPEEDREGAESMAQMVEHVIASPEHHPGLEDRPLTARCADNLLGRPLRLVIGRATVRPRTQEAEQRNPTHARLLSSEHLVGGAAHVDDLVALGADLAIDTGAVGHRLAALERLRQCELVGDAGRRFERAGAP